MYLSSVGADLKEIEPHTRELGKVVEEMKKKLVTEVRILEGTEVESYLTAVSYTHLTLPTICSV